jgi:CubicO group peptidase (beta-lactamase class C family)
MTLRNVLLQKLIQTYLKNKEVSMKIIKLLPVVMLIAGCLSQDSVNTETIARSSAKDSGTTVVNDAVGKYVDSGEIAGCISILYKDGVQEVACLGYSDVDKKRPITLDDPFMQCSQTKGFCGVTIAKLIEEGKISLDDPVSKYLPEFKNPAYSISKRDAQGKMHVTVHQTPITIRMCMNHTAGFPFELPNAQLMGGWSRRMPLRSVAATANSQRVLFEPGKGVAYSNVGIDVGAAVVEAVTGMPWEEYLKKTVLEPLGMNNTTFWPTEKQLETKIELYDIKKDNKAKYRYEAQWMQRPYNDNRVFASAGAGLWTTARDQLKFYKMLMNLGLGDNGVRILKEETVKKYLAVSTRQIPNRKDGYSLGLTAPAVDTEDSWFGHGGAWGTNCMVSHHKRLLKLWVIQKTGEIKDVDKAWAQACKSFFETNIEKGDASAYTGRMK